MKQPLKPQFIVVIEFGRIVVVRFQCWSWKFLVSWRRTSLNHKIDNHNLIKRMTFVTVCSCKKCMANRINCRYFDVYASIIWWKSASYTALAYHQSYHKTTQRSLQMSFLTKQELFLKIGVIQFCIFLSQFTEEKRLDLQKKDLILSQYI